MHDPIKYICEFSSLQRKCKNFDIGDPINIHLIKDYPSARITDINWIEKYLWCQENFGDNWVWARWGTEYHTMLYFVDEADAIKFILRFGKS